MKLKLKQLWTNHKGKIIIGVVIVAGTVYLAIRKREVKEDDGFLMFMRELLPGEDPTAVAKSIMGPNMIQTVAQHWWEAPIQYVVHGDSQFIGQLIK